jgi:hypothetical protein
MRLSPLLLGLTTLAAILSLGEPSLRADPPEAPSPEAPSKDKDKDRQQAAADFANAVVPFLSKNCFACHGNGKKRGDVALDGYKSIEAVQQDRDLWESVLEMVRSGQMPPKNAKKFPSVPEVELAVRALDDVLTQFDCSGPRNAGRVTLRRLNRTEYNNTIRDLVGVDFKPAADFPEDDVGYGFDNIGDVLTLSPLLLERYLSAAEAILEQAIVIDDPPKPTKTRLGRLRIALGAGESRGGTAVLRALGSAAAETYFEEGDYTIRIEASAKLTDDEPLRAAFRIDGETIKTIEVKADASAPVTIEFPSRIKSGSHRVAIVFLNPSKRNDEDEDKEKVKDKPQRELTIRGVGFDGPYNPPAAVLPESHKRLMAHRPDLAPREAAREILTRFASAAFRRPVKPEEVEVCLDLYDRAEKEGERFENRVKLALGRILVSPQFLFRVELDPPGAEPGTSYLISEYELASRLSYFLWSSMPDAELFALAAKGELRKNLIPQVQRMLQDPKSSAFVQNFSGQWLTTRKLAFVSPDTKEFPTFNEELRQAMVRETELFFEAILREDRSILDFLDADFSFVNEPLAKHYGIQGVKGKQFRRVTLPPNRGGILTQASILTLTSNPTRTSPVKRGKWVLDQVLGTPPPPPPPDVPALPEEKQLTGTLRQVMEQHRSNALCASCHQRMDPIGFAFENYDAIGAWRDKDGEFPIDPSGVLPGGQSFQGPAELKTILRGKKDHFARCLTEMMLTYAIGRGLEYFDKCAVDTILQVLDENHDRFSTLVVEVIKSEPFQMRTATGDEP